MCDLLDSPPGPVLWGQGSTPPNSAYHKGSACCCSLCLTFVRADIYLPKEHKHESICSVTRRSCVPGSRPGFFYPWSRAALKASPVSAAPHPPPAQEGPSRPSVGGEAPPGPVSGGEGTASPANNKWKCRQASGGPRQGQVHTSWATGVSSPESLLSCPRTRGLPGPPGPSARQPAGSELLSAARRPGLVPPHPGRPPALPRPQTLRPSPRPSTTLRSQWTGPRPHPAALRGAEDPEAQAAPGGLRGARSELSTEPPEQPAPLPAAREKLPGVSRPVCRRLL